MVVETPPPPPPTKETAKETRPKTIHNAACVFVRQIPFEATSAQLEAFFADVGPIKSAFVVADKDNDTPNANKGFGFVTFAVKDDAAKAIDKLKDEKFLGQRKLKLELAIKKNIDPAAKPERPQKKEKLPPAAKKNPHPSAVPKPAPKTQRESRLVEITKLPDGIDKSHIKHKVKKMGNVIEVFFPVLDADGQERKGVAQVKYRQATDAAFAVKKLNNHVFKGVTIFATLLELPKHHEGEADPETLAAREAKKSRLIVRNLNFSTTEKQLHKAFNAHGNVLKIDVPQQTTPKGGVTGKGFAFVHMENMEDAETAMNKVNGTKIAGRVVAVDWALSKTDFARLAAEEENGESTAAEGDEENAEDGDDAAEVTREEEDVDAGDEEVDEDEGHDHVYPEDDDEEDDDEDADEDDDVKITMDDEVLQEGKEDADDEEEADEEAEEAPKKSKFEANVSEGCTIFVRNLLFETTEEELFARFVTFGKLRYVRITKDPQSGKSRGTGFICFYSREDTDACMAAYAIAAKSHALYESTLDTPATPAKPEKRDYRKGAANKDKDKKKDSFASKSMLVPEPSTTSAVTAPFILGGRFLVLTLAVTRQESEKLTSAGVKDRRANDRRHMYLIKEGVIFPNSKEAVGILPTELSRRQKSYTERKRLLASNPNLYLSRTRLSIRNLNMKVTEDSLRRAGVLCVKRFWEEVKARKRKGLEEEVLDEDKAEGKAPPGTDRPIKVAKCKIMLDMHKFEPGTKKNRSKGFGFLEFYHHSDALACLRYLNANNRVFKSDGLVYSKEELDALDAGEVPEATLAALAKARRPIVEFTVENRLIASKKKELVEQQRAAAAEARAKGVPLAKKEKNLKKEDKKGGDKKAGEKDGKKGGKRQRDEEEDSTPSKKSKKDSAEDKKAAGKKRKADDAGDSKKAVSKKDTSKKEEPSAVSKKAKKVDKDAEDDQAFTQLLAKYGKGLFGPESKIMK
ncbi:RNA recognition motif-containing protein [Rhizoclosmatium sp. JEL0117]|nr:RNA recognition motif-containing protein [Rhizoclosmatium sp. JEL0117]